MHRVYRGNCSGDSSNISDTIPEDVGEIPRNFLGVLMNSWEFFGLRRNFIGIATNS